MQSKICAKPGVAAGLAQIFVLLPKSRSGASLCIIAEEQVWSKSLYRHRRAGLEQIFASLPKSRSGASVCTAAENAEAVMQTAFVAADRKGIYRTAVRTGASWIPKSIMSYVPAFGVCRGFARHIAGQALPLALEKCGPRRFL